jgi:hypothetical protein
VNDPVQKSVFARTTTASATLTDELSISTPTPDEAFLDWDPSHGMGSAGGRPMHGTYKDVETGCDGQVHTAVTPFDFLSPELHIRVPVSVGRVAHGNATILYDANGNGVQIPSELMVGLTPNKSSDVGWDLAGGSQHHYVIEVRSWIPLQRVAHPMFPNPYSWDKSLARPYSDLSPNCVIMPEDEQKFTEVSATFRGDGHKGFDGTYRLADRIEFDYDGQSISNLTVTPGFAHVGETHEDKRYTVVGMSDPHPARECTRVGTAPDRSGATASGRTFQVSYSGSNPLVPAAPAIDHAINGRFRDNGTILMEYTVTNFPSSGLRVTRDGIEIANVMTNDASCLTEESAAGKVGAARLGYGLITTRTGTFDIDYRSPVRLTIQSALCSGLWSP